jgi:hypothetical protein
MMNRRVANPHLYLVNATCLPTKKDLFTFESATSSISMNRWKRLEQSASSSEIFTALFELELAEKGSCWRAKLLRSV